MRALRNPNHNSQPERTESDMEGCNVLNQGSLYIQVHVSAQRKTGMDGGNTLPDVQICTGRTKVLGKEC